MRFVHHFEYYVFLLIYIQLKVIFFTLNYYTFLHFILSVC